ncbi:Mu-like prophage major head subunit gpT family protein [Geminisphaera colitermitum]|uniref:Mu-like prophage major head subunit gpT family protein n=1 Tax=Geminisphaera colitermitum TaxID=1148786 RepID=UPI000158C614|nr:Mu-like prophage major head subunit gpT family protein [Geminisphaera colitermitum]
MQLTPHNIANLYKTLRTIFFAAYQAAPDDVANSLAMRTQSSAAEEVYHWLGAFPGMKKLIDEIKIENVRAHNYTIPNDEWEDTIGIKQADVERDEAGAVGLYRPRFQIMGDTAKQHDGEMVADLLCNGFTRKCYTGKNFFDVDHEPIPGKTKFTNKTTKKLSQANYRAGRVNIKTRKNAVGRAMKLGRDLVLLVGATNEALGFEILKAERSDNGKTNVDKDTARLIVWPEIDVINPEAWFLYDAAQPVKPIIVQEEKPVDMLALDDPEDDHVFKKHEFLYQAYKRTGYGYGLPEVIYGSDGSAAA